MPVPISQMWTVATYVLKQKLRGRKRYPFVLMLEPLFRCNLACAGCGKIQYPAHILKTELSPEECLKAVDECGTPMVSIPGGEPLMHPQIEKIVEGLVARKKYIFSSPANSSRFPCTWMDRKSITIFPFAARVATIWPSRASGKRLSRASASLRTQRYSTAPTRKVSARFSTK